MCRAAAASSGQASYHCSVVSHETETVRVNFGQPTPLFPLHTVTLFPHTVLPLHIFEPRYRQMVEHVLDRAGQIALAVIDADASPDGCGRPTLRPAVCIGQVIQHERLLDGRYNILLQGICRAQVLVEEPPDEDRLYRQALLQPIESNSTDAAALEDVRDRLRGLLTDAPLNRLSAAENVASCLSRPEAPTTAVLELVVVSIITNDDVRYRLLAEGDPLARAKIIDDELESLRALLNQAEKQLDPTSPKGVTWN